jgi:hypothetical protein
LAFRQFGRCGAIAGNEIRRVEVCDTIKPAPVPNNFGELPDDRFVALDRVGAP